MTSQSVSSIISYDRIFNDGSYCFYRTRMQVLSSFNFEVYFFTYLPCSVVKNVGSLFFTPLSVTANDL